MAMNWSATCMGFGWAWVAVGLVLGAGVGLRFHEPDFLGGYDGWRRRLVRLGHIAFLGTGGLNILFGLSMAAVEAPDGMQLRVAGLGWIAGAVTMPVCCFLAAWQRRWRHLFPIPVFCLITAAAVTAWLIWAGGGRHGGA